MQEARQKEVEEKKQAQEIEVASNTSELAHSESLGAGIQVIAALPHECPVVRDQMVRLFLSIGKPEYAKNIDVFLKQLYQSLLTSRYNNLWLAYKNLTSTDLKKEISKLRGFLWVECDNDNLGNNFTKIKEIFIEEGDDKVSVITQLMKKHIYFCKRNMIELNRLEATTYDLQELWARVGFKPVCSVMELRGVPDQVITSNAILEFIDRRKANG